MRLLLPTSAFCALASIAVCSAAPVAAGPLDRAPLGVARSTAAVASAPVGFSLHLPLRNEQQLLGIIRNQGSKSSPLYQHYLTPAQFAASFAPSDAQRRAVATMLRAQGFTVDRIGVQEVHAVGTAAVFARAFGAPVRIASVGRRTRLVTQSAVKLDGALAKTGATFIGLTPAIRHFAQFQSARTANRESPFGAYWFTDLKQAYQYPSTLALNGRGRTVAVLMGSTYNPADANAYWDHEKLTPRPHVIVRNVDGGAPYDPQDMNASEADIDVQQIGGTAPGASIIDYSIPDLSDASIYDGLSAIVTENAADIVNASIGGCELFYTAAYNGGVDQTATLKAFDQLFQQGSAEGISFVVSSGDNGALACPDPNFTHFVRGVSSPADDPNVVAVGGTNLETSFALTKNGARANRNAFYVSENAYADRIMTLDYYGIGQPLGGGLFGSGGGVSVVFPKPFYQYLVPTRSTMRTVPDLAMHMGGCPTVAIQPCRATDSSDFAVFNGQLGGVIGTSLASPDFAALLALREQALGGRRLGNANYEIYALAAIQSASNGALKIFRTSIPGSNGYDATPGYNYVLGNGTVYGAAFAGSPAGPFAGEPLTPTNP